MPVTSVSALVELLQQCNLLLPAQLPSVAELELQGADPRAAAEMLARRKLLTSFQVEQLFSDEPKKNLVIGPYVLLERLGEGGMGQVFKARHRLLNRVVALKLIHEDRIQRDPEAVRRFEREARAAASLSHPNIVLLYDAAATEDNYYIAMEYIEGIDLGRQVRESGPLPVVQACDYIRQAALGLQHAHENGLVHRDIKPSNLLLARPHGLRSAGVIKILDMGLVRVTRSEDRSGHGSLTEEGRVVGTPDYIAPEQARDARRADIRADLYSLGATFYFLLTGQPPFNDGSAIEKLLMHQLDEPVPVEKRRADVPTAVALIISKLLAKQPRDRYQSPAELAMALSAALGRPSPPPPSAPVDPHITPTGLHVNMVPSAAAPTPLADDSGSIKRSGPTSPGVRPDRVEAENICRPAQHLSALAGHSGSVLCVAFSPDRNILASGGLDATTRVWDFSATQPRQRALLRKHVGEVHSLVFSPDGGLLASGSGSSDGLIWVGSVVRAEPQDISFLRGHFGSVDALAFSPDGRTLASGGQDATVRIWEIAGSQSSCRTVLKGHTQPVRAVAFAPDGQVVAGAAMDGTVRLWDLSRLWSKEWAMLRHPEAVNSIAFSSEGDLLVTGSADHVVRVWDVGSANPQLLGELTDHDQPVHIVLITQDGQRLIAAGEGRRVTVWDEDGEKIQEWLVPRLMHRYLALTLDGRYLASGALDGVVHVYRIAERRPNGKPAPPS